MFSLLLIFALDGTKSHHIRISPLDFSNEAIPNTLVRDIAQIEVADDLIYIRELMDPRILVIDRNGKYVKRIGKIGQGPTELGQNSISFGVKGPSLWTIGKDVKTAHYFEHGEQVMRIAVPNYNWF